MLTSIPLCTIGSKRSGCLKRLAKGLVAKRRCILWVSEFGSTDMSQTFSRIKKKLMASINTLYTLFFINTFTNNASLKFANFQKISRTEL